MKVLAAVLLILTGIDSFAQVEPLVSTTLVFNDGRGNVRSLRFGADPIATDGIDIIFGESLLPPFPPAGILEVQFYLPTNNFSGEEASYWDFRQGSDPVTGTREHRIKYQKGEGDSVIISWDFPETITASLKDMFTGTYVNVEMTGTGSYVITNPGSFTTLKLIVQYDNTTGLGSDIPEPEEFKLLQNYPNPFNPTTTISYTLADREWVSLKVFDLLGNEVMTLVNEEKPAGTYQAAFDAGNLSSGIYLYQITAGVFSDSRTMVLLK